MHSDTLYRVALSRVRKIGPIISRALYDHFGSAEAIFTARPKELRAVEGVGERLATELRRPEPQAEAEAILGFAERHEIQILHYRDPDYPRRFLRQPTSPTLFYHWGTTDLNHKRTVAIVGTRKPTGRGVENTERLVAELEGYGALVISGLAYGIDICAHRQALKWGLNTLGIMGSGLNHIYPSTHRSTATAMLAQGGLLTTYPHFVGPERDHFPARNRLVAQLADIVVVMESEARGGSMITAQMARAAGKPVGAFPGRRSDKKSAGCNALIKQDGGHLLEGAADLAKILGWHQHPVANRQGELFQQLSPAEQSIVDHLGEIEDLGLDELRRQLDWPAGQLATQLLSMECKGLVRAMAGGRYRLAG